MVQIADAHVHIWEEGQSWNGWQFDNERFRPLRGSRSLAHLAEQMDSAGVSTCLLMQAATVVEETAYLLGEAAATDRVRGVIGWVSLSSPQQTEADLEALGALPGLVGVRHLDGPAPDGRVVAEGRARESIRLLAERQLTLDVQMSDFVIVEELERIGRDHPGLVIVVDHLGGPPEIDDPHYLDWGAAISRLAQTANIYVKFSGWTTRWRSNSIEALRPYLDHVVGEFSDARVIFSSNWPVSDLALSYAETCVRSVKALEQYGPAPARRILSENLFRAYGLSPGA